MNAVTDMKTRQVTSRRHEHALTVLLDDIRLQMKQTNGPGPATKGQSDSTAYERAQALELRVQNWVRHEMDFCEFRNELRRLLIEKLNRRETGVGFRE